MNMKKADGLYMNSLKVLPTLAKNTKPAFIDGLQGFPMKLWQVSARPVITFG